MGKKKLLGFCGVGGWRIAPVVPGDVPRFRSPGKPGDFLRVGGWRRAFLSRNSTSNRNMALLSGKLILRLLVPPNFCKCVAIAGGSSSSSNAFHYYEIKTIIYINKWTINQSNEWTLNPNSIRIQLNSINCIPFKISCSKLAVGTTITNTTPGIISNLLHWVQLNK